MNEHWVTALRPRVFVARLTRDCGYGHEGDLVWIAQYAGIFAVAHTPLFALRDFERAMTMPAALWQQNFGYVHFEELKGAVDDVR